MRIVFMGSPEFAVPSLRAIHAAGHEIVGVITQPDRPAGRGNKLAPPAVKEAALELCLPVLQFERVRRKEGVKAIAGLAPEVIVTAAFGQILPASILELPLKGVINVHASLLPAYRGPAPINWCIALGETRSGVTTMFTDIGVDTGDMIDRIETPIGDEETAGELTERLSRLGAELIVQTLAKVLAGTASRTPQDPVLASHHPMLDKETGQINWTWPAKRVRNHVRGMDPWPGAWTRLGGETLKLWKVAPAEQAGEAGRVLSADGKNGLVIGCGEGAVRVLLLQAPGKPRMAAEDWLRGHPLPIGTQLTGGNE